MNYPMVAALGRMADARQFFVYRLDWNAEKNKYEKNPIGSPASACMTFAQARVEVERMVAQGQKATVGMWIDAGSGLFFLDVDGMPEMHQLDDRGTRAVTSFPGAFVEWSSSGRGLHVIGTLSGPLPHACKNTPLNVEFYTSGRGVALNLDATPRGCLDSVHDVSTLVADWFPPKQMPLPMPPSASLLDDEVVIEKMLAARLSAAATFGSKTTPRELWEGLVAKNSEHDMALAAHLAFWTGRNAAQIERLMWRSGLVRDKWRDHRTYLQTTIANACAGTTSIYQSNTNDEAEEGSATATSDLSNAYRIKTTYGDDLIAVDGIGWHVWQEGGPWRYDPPAVYRLAFQLGKIISAEAEAMQSWVDDPTVAGGDEAARRLDVQRNRQRWAKASESRAAINSALMLLENLLPCRADSLDADAMLVGCPSGVIDLATCAVRAHLRADKITKTIACDYDPSARAPSWERFVSEIFAGDLELISYVQTLCGYILSGNRGHHLLPVFYGTGANGKSTFLSTLQALLGDYAGAAPPGMLMARVYDQHPTELTTLQGKRLIVASETGEGGRLAEQKVKALTGGDRISARRISGNYYEFNSTHVIILATNHKPRVIGQDEGIWRRLKLVPFQVTVPPEQRDPELPQKLLKELPGILSWVVQGWQMYQRDGFREPAAVKLATSEYRSDSDHIGTFISEKCLVGPEHTCTISALFQAYSAWCMTAGEHPLSQRTFSQRLRDRGEFEQVRTMHARQWQGITVDHAAVFRSTPADVIKIKP